MALPLCVPYDRPFSLPRVSIRFDVLAAGWPAARWSHDPAAEGTPALVNATLKEGCIRGRVSRYALARGRESDHRRSLLASRRFRSA